MLKSAFGSNKVIVVGDIHGDLNQLMYPLIRFLKNTNKYRKLVFLGDYIDRGESNLYIYAIIEFMRSLPKFKNQIIFLRGNHECYPTAIRDYYNDNWKTSNWDKRFIQTFVYPSIHNVNFDIVNYDSELNVVFSHSPLSRPLAEVLHMNETKLDEDANVSNTFTDDSESSKMEYKNIHGHIHRMSSDGVVDKFANDERKMLSVDGDASYGIVLVQNFMSTARKSLTSHVQYLVIHDKNTYDVVNEDIDFFDYNRNFNTFKFDQLKRSLSSANSYVANQIDKLKFASVMNIFVNAFDDCFKTKPKTENVVALIRRGYEQNIRLRSGSCVYFHDVPVDVYNALGLFNDEQHNEIGKLFWCRVLGLDATWKRNYTLQPLRSNETTKSLLGIDTSANAYTFLRTFIFITTGIVLVILMCTYAVNFYYRTLYRRVALNQMEKEMNENEYASN